MPPVEWRTVGDAVWLTTTGTARLTLEEVVRQADAAGYRELDVDAVAAVLAGGEARAVARVPATARPGWVEIVVGDDAMTATLVVVPPSPDAPPLTSGDVDAALETADVRLGVDHLVLDSLPLDRPGQYLVARGWLPEPGRDGSVDFVVPVVRELRPAARDDGGVDFRAVATVPQVRAGEIIAQLVDPEPGTPGRTVTGGVLEPDAGRPAVLPAGPNVNGSPDGRYLVAKVDGLLEVSGDRVAVRPDLVVPGDIDFETGSIDFAGDIVVRGSVRSGFRARAGGRLVVLGDVENALLEAEELIWVRGAAVGAKTVVRGTGDVKVRTVHEARIEARGNVYVEREAADAVILAGHDVVLERPRNRLAGGVVRAGGDVVVAELGSIAEVATRVCAGTDPFLAEAREAVHAELTQHQRALTRVEIAVAPFHADPDQLDRLGPERRASVTRLLDAELALRAKVSELADRVAQLEPADLGERPKIVVRHALRPNVTLEITGARRRVERNEFRVAVGNLAGQLVLEPLGPGAGSSPKEAMANASTAGTA